LCVAGKTIRIEFRAARPAPLSPSATEIIRQRFSKAGVEFAYWRDGRRGCYRMRWSDAGVFDLDARRGRVRCHLRPAASPDSVEEVLRGPVCSFFLVEHGFEPLHAGAVVLGGNCLAFAGEPGAGKSSLIACLARRGARFFADDVLPLRLSRHAVRAWPGLPQLRLAPRSLRHLHWPGRTLRATPWKSTLEARPASGVKTVTRVFLLERKKGGAVAVEPLTPRQAFLALVSHTRNIAETAPHRLRNQLKVCAWLANRVPVRRLVYPSGFHRLPNVRRAILEDLKS
jgi:hypothetical protein